MRPQGPAVPNRSMQRQQPLELHMLTAFVVVCSDFDSIAFVRRDVECHCSLRLVQTCNPASILHRLLQYRLQGCWLP